MICIENLCFQYSNGNKALKNININIDSGEFVAIIGQNGSGKSTLMKHLNGLLKATSGKITLCGMDASKTKTSILASKIGFLFQNPDHQIFCSTVFEEIAFGLKNLGVKNTDIEKLVYEAAMRVGIQGYLNCDPFNLSKGQRQRVALASVLAMKTELLVLDEPTTGQDYSEAIEIMEIVKELNMQGITVIMVTHDMELVALYADRIIVIQNGFVLDDGPTNEILGREGTLALSSIKAPQAYLLAKKFHEQGYFINALAVEDIFDEIICCLEGEPNASNG